MSKRIYNILIISSTYDYFILEEDGRIDEQIFSEYTSLGLRYPPKFFNASDEDKAFHIIKSANIDIIIAMLSVGDKNILELSKTIKNTYPGIPICLLTPFSRKVFFQLNTKDNNPFEFYFHWLGNADILLAIIKIIEDKMNVEHDVKEVGVQTILFVENSIKYYSVILPILYKLLFKQSKKFMLEGLNEHQKMLQLRGRPKILHATNYEEAITYYKKYKNNLLGVISDVGFTRDGEDDLQAGIKLCVKIRSDNKFVPILLQSSNKENKIVADKINVGFLHKHSKNLSKEIKDYINDSFLFGDFIFKDPKSHEEISRATDLKALQQRLKVIPDETLKFHSERNDFSKWLNARALFHIAKVFKWSIFSDFDDVTEVRNHLYETISKFRFAKVKGVIAEFNPDKFDEYFIFSRIGQGSIGGKARGLAFIDVFINRNRINEKYENINITIPRTVVLTTDIYEEFMDQNNLYKIGLSDIDENQIFNSFISAELPQGIQKDLIAILSVIKNPIAVRSSSILEDSYFQPFAGIYSTYMIANLENDIDRTLKQLNIAIKSVYASIFLNESKSYMLATSHNTDEEEMAIVLQEVCGKKYRNRFYPTISGVARSINYYPLSPEKPEDGIANIALGLGKHIVDGEVTLRFSPKYPKKIMQLSSTDMALKETQKFFYSLDLNPESFKLSVNDDVNILRQGISEAVKDNSIRQIASSYDFENNLIRDNFDYSSDKVITFSNILNHNIFPLAEILQDVLSIGQREMNNPVEIEFAVDLNRSGNYPIIFNLLQIRPIVDLIDTSKIDFDGIKHENTIIYSEFAFGNGIIKNLCDFVYVKPEMFHPSKNKHIASRILDINKKFISEDKNYILVGPGRWGSSDPWLGIPVKWVHVSAAKVIIESGQENYRIEPSQGTHFFQNLTSLNVGYFTINPHIKDGFYNLDYLSKFNAFYEDEYIRHIRFDKPLRVVINGKKNKGVIFKMVEN